jgi:hypothetical protein
MALSNTEKQARYRERHLGVDGAKCASDHSQRHHQGATGAAYTVRRYTLTALIEDLVGSAGLPGAQALSGRRITRRQQCGYVITTKDGTQSGLLRGNHKPMRIIRSSNTLEVLSEPVM